MPLNLFGISFGLTGLAGTWTAASRVLEVPQVVANVLWGIAAVAFATTLIRYVSGARRLRTMIADLQDPVIGPFAALAPIVATLFGERLHSLEPVTAQVWVLVTTTVSFLFGAWFLKHLLSGGLEITKLHSGYLLPTVAAGLISAQALAHVGLHPLALGAFGAGMLFWLLLGAVILYRTAFHPQPSAQLLPTLAIFSAPPAVAGNAWFALSANQGVATFDTLQASLFGIFLLLIALQLFLVPTYLRTPFSLGFWAVTFTAAASGRYAAEVLALVDAPGSKVGQWAALLLSSAVVAVVAGASVRLVADIRKRRL